MNFHKFIVLISVLRHPAPWHSHLGNTLSSYQYLHKVA